jgi:transcriptional regulator with XRE-family HTH domain
VWRGDAGTNVRPMNQAVATKRVGPLLRDWRLRRRLSQLDLALEAGVSARHLSFVETGRSRPSAEMVLHLTERLSVPLRERNRLLLAAGHAPVFEQRDLEDPEMAPIRQVLQQILDGHDPYPAVVVDGAWEMVAANSAVGLLTEGVAPDLLEPPLNVLRVSLHPDGLAPRIANLGEWRAHLLDRLRRQIALTADPALKTLLDELLCYPGPEYEPERGGPDAAHDLAVPLRLRGDAGELTFISTIATFGTAVEVTASELSIESFFSADRATDEALRAASVAPSHADR